MNNVILFQPVNSSRRVASREGGAQILFFTGVRYQRMSEDPPAPARTPRAARRKGHAAAGGQKSQR